MDNSILDLATLPSTYPTLVMIPNRLSPSEAMDKRYLPAIQSFFRMMAGFGIAGYALDALTLKQEAKRLTVSKGADRALLFISSAFRATNCSIWTLTSTSLERLINVIPPPGQKRCLLHHSKGFSDFRLTLPV